MSNEMRAIEDAPEDEPVILATTGGWIGEAVMVRDDDTGEQKWTWAGNVAMRFRPLGWFPMPTHPAPDLDNP